MAIFAVVSAALIRNAAQAVNQTGIIQERTLAYWIAENQINQLRLKPRISKNYPAIGSERVAVTLAGRDWEVVLAVEATENKDMRRVVVKVYSSQDAQREVAQLAGFIGRF